MIRISRTVTSIGCAVVALLAALKVDAGIQWQHATALAGPGHAGMQIGDFDGDGRNELAVTAFGAPLFGFNPDQSVVLHQPLDGPGSAIGRTHISIWPDGFQSRLLIIRRPGKGDQLLTVIQPSQQGPATVLLLTGVPLRVEREIAAPVNFRPAAIGDVDGDGSLDVLGIVSGSAFDAGPVVSIDLQTGVSNWTSTQTARRIAILQFDADPALEIALSGAPGLILDGASRQVEFNYPGGFGDLVAGNFDADPLTTELASTAIGELVQIFRSAPFSPIREFAVGPINVIQTYDRNADGIDEIITAYSQYGAVRIHDAVSGNVLLTVPNPVSGASAVAIGELDGLPGAELAFSGGLGSTGQDIVSINHLADGQSIYLSNDEAGPHSTVLLADVDADRIEEAVFVAPTSASGFGGSRIYVLNADDGRVERMLPPGPSFGYALASGALVAGQFDDDAPLEIAYAMHGADGRGVNSIDGLSLQPQWALGQTTFGSIDMVAADLHGRGSPVLVAATQDSRLAIIDPANGALLWTSIALAQFGASALAVANVDADPALEMLISAAFGVYAFDGTTYLLDWSLNSSSGVRGLQVWGSGASCRIGTWEPSAWVVRRCSDRSIVDTVEVPADSLYVRVLDDDGRLVAVTAGGRLQVFESGRGRIYQTPYYGYQLGDRNKGVIRPVTPGRVYDALFGTSQQVLRFQFDLDDLHRDGFE